jgi:hypothetical protein
VEPTPCAGITRIRFEGLRRMPHSQRLRAPLSFKVSSVVLPVQKPVIQGVGDTGFEPVTSSV